MPFMSCAIRFLISFSISLVLAPDGLPAQENVAGREHALTNSAVEFSHLKQGDNDFPPPLRLVPNPAFRVGEVLEYHIRYGPIVAGNSRLSIPEMLLYNGHPSLKIVSEAWSTSFFSKVYKVDDRVESITDARGLFSWYFKKRLREGSFKQDIEIIYDQEKQLTYVDGDTIEVTPFVLDVLAALYYVRTQPMAPGDTLFIDHQDNKKLYPLKVVVHGRETIKTRAGKFDCLVVEPFLREPGLFKARGRLIIHMTDDHRKIPVRMTTKIYVSKFNLGDVVAELEKMEGVMPE